MNTILMLVVVCAVVLEVTAAPAQLSIGGLATSDGKEFKSKVVGDASTNAKSRAGNIAATTTNLADKHKALSTAALGASDSGAAAVGDVTSDTDDGLKTTNVGIGTN